MTFDYYPDTSGELYRRYKVAPDSPGGITRSVRRGGAMPDRVPAMIVLRPGDKVLLTLSEDPDVNACEDILRSLKASFPGVDFTVLSGVTGLAVAPPE